MCMGTLIAFSPPICSAQAAASSGTRASSALLILRR